MAPHSSTTAVAAAQTPHRASTSTQNPQQQAPRSMSSSSSTAQSTGGAAALGAAGSTTATTTTPLARSRQYTHLHAQLAQLNAHLADTENLLHMTAVQAEYLRGLGAWWGGAFMAASKTLGEETATGGSAAVADANGGKGKGLEDQRRGG